MLVLSRKESQRIQLGDSIVLTIVRVNGDRVRVGIEAPAEVQVRRGELTARAAGRGQRRRRLMRVGGRSRVGRVNESHHDPMWDSSLGTRRLYAP